MDPSEFLEVRVSSGVLKEAKTRSASCPAILPEILKERTFQFSKSLLAREWNNLESRETSDMVAVLLKSFCCTRSRLRIDHKTSAQTCTDFRDRAFRLRCVSAHQGRCRDPGTQRGLNEVSLRGQEWNDTGSIQAWFKPARLEIGRAKRVALRESRMEAPERPPSFMCRGRVTSSGLSVSQVASLDYHVSTSGQFASGQDTH